MADMILKYVMGLAFTILTYFITYIILPELSAWIRSKIHNERYKGFVDDITTTVATTVNYLEQTMVTQYKADGGWNKESQEAVLESAVKQVTESITEQTKKLIEEQQLDIREIVTRHIEAYIREQKG